MVLADKLPDAQKSIDTCKFYFVEKSQINKNQIFEFPRRYKAKQIRQRIWSSLPQYSPLSVILEAK